MGKEKAIGYYQSFFSNTDFNVIKSTYLKSNVPGIKENYIITSELNSRNEHIQVTYQIFENNFYDADTFQIDFYDLVDVKSINPLLGSYDFNEVYEVFSHFSLIGKQLGFIGETNEDYFKHLSFSDFYRSDAEIYTSDKTNAALIKYQSFINTNSPSMISRTEKAFSCLRLYFQIKNNKVTPVVEIRLPFSFDDRVTYAIKINEIKNTLEIDSIKNAINVKYNERADHQIKRHLKLNSDEIQSMDSAQKRHYLDVIEMMRI